MLKINIICMYIGANRYIVHNIQKKLKFKKPIIYNKVIGYITEYSRIVIYIYNFEYINNGYIKKFNA